MYFIIFFSAKRVSLRAADNNGLRRFKVFLFRAKKELRINRARVYSDLFIDENLTALNYSLFKKLKSEKKNDAAKTTWQILRWFIHIKEKFL